MTNLVEKIAKALIDSEPDDCEDIARAAIAAIEASGTHRVVPVVTTPEMIEAAWDNQPAKQVSFLLGYEAMIAAAPKVLP